MQPVLPYVYKCTNPTTGEFYIGYRTANTVNAACDAGIVYFSSSKHIKSHKDDFVFNVIAEFFRKHDAYEYEQCLIREYISDPLCLNKNVGGTPILSDHRWFTDGVNNVYTNDSPPQGFVPGRSGVKGKSRPGSLNPSFGKRGCDNPNTGKKRSEEFKQRNSEIHKGKVTSEETKGKISKANAGKKGLVGDANPSKRPEVREKIRQSRIGTSASDETKQKMRESKLGKTRGPYKTKSKDSHAIE